MKGGILIFAPIILGLEVYNYILSILSLSPYSLNPWLSMFHHDAGDDVGGFIAAVGGMILILLHRGIGFYLKYIDKIAEAKEA